MTLHTFPDLVQGSDEWLDARRGILTLPLTRGLVAILDAEDAEIVAGRRWHAIRSRQTYYAGSWSGSSRPSGSSIVRMHTLLTGFALVDHINRDGLDNRRSNLREATLAQNARNRRMQTNNTSGYRGVSFFAPRRKYMAYITADGKRTHLGYFDTAEEAGRARDEMALSLHGEFAALNFPLGGVA